MFLECNCSPNYSVNEEGVIRNNKTGRIMKTHYHKDGYKKLRIPVDGVMRHKFVHRLVAQAFLPNPDNKPIVNHIDGIRDNNHLSNLEWVTSQENYDHMGHRMYFDKIREIYYLNRNATLDEFMQLIQKIGYI